MKVLHLMQDSYLPDIAGNPIVLDSFRKAISRRHENIILVWNCDRPELEIINDVPVYNIKDCSEFETKLKEIIDNNNVDIIITHSFDEDNPTEKIKSINLPKILVAHFEYEKISEIHSIFDKIISFQEEHINKYVRKNVPRNKLFFCPPPRDIRKWKPKDTEKRERTILYVGRLIRAKGLHQIIPKLDKLDASLTWIGPNYDEDYKKEIENIIEENDLNKRVNLLGEVSENRLIEEYNKHSVFVLLSNSDCYSLVLQECILTGLPAVALENYGHYDWTKGRIFIENTVRMCYYRLKMILDGKCNIEYDEDFCKKLSLEYNAPRLNDMLDNIKNEIDFQWNENFERLTSLKKT